MAFLQKLCLWVLLFPLTMIGYTIVHTWTAVVFVFNSPFDVWLMISSAVEETKHEL